MKHFVSAMIALAIGVSLCVSTSALAQGSGHKWSKRFGGVGYDQTLQQVTDAAGNIYVIGFFFTSIDFGGGPMNSAGANDIFVAKLDSNGNHIWSRHFGSTGADIGSSIAVDPAGNVYITGWFYESVNFGGGLLTSAGSNDIFLVRLDPNGSHIWSKRFGSVASDFGEDVAVDPAGNIVITGAFVDQINFGGGLLTSAGNYDVYVAKFNSAGSFILSKRFGDGGEDFGQALAVDSAGNIIVDVYFTGSISFGGGVLNSLGNDDIAIAKLDTNGNHIWSKRFGSTGFVASYDITTDAANRIVFSGTFANTIDFGGGPLNSAGGSDAFIAKLDAGGSFIFSRRAGDTGNDSAYAVAVDSSMNVIVAGVFYGTINWIGGGPNLSTGADPSTFVTKFSPGGSQIWSNAYPTSTAYACATDSNANVIVSGGFFNTVNFGGGNLTAADNYDVFIAKFGPNPPCFADVVVDGTVNVSDLLAVINGWGPCPGACTAPCPADIVHDCTVNVIDLLAVINGWGACP